MPAPLVHVDREQLRARVAPPSRSCSSVYSARSGACSITSAASTDRTSEAASRKCGLQDRLPLLEPVLVDTLEPFRSSSPPRTLTDALLAAESR